MAQEIPEKMKAIHFVSPGGPEVLALTEVDVPQPRAGEVLIEVAYAGVNRPDVIQRQGHYPAPPGASPLLGLEVSGKVVSIGDGVEPEWLNRIVCALTPGGGYAQYCRTPASQCLPVGDAIPLAEAAAIPETLFTVWHNVFQRGYARQGERLLVHGGTSGIGTMAIMLAKAFGLDVIVTCGSDAKCTAAKKFGADHAINYRETDFVEEIGAITDGNGVEIVLDMVSGDYVPRNLKCLAEDGRHVTIAVLGGMTAQLNMAVIMSRRLTLTGSTLRPRSDEFKAMLCAEIEANAWPLFLDGEVCPVMDRTYPLADASGAHARMEKGEHIGKIILEVGGG
uniref:NAD(P)H-quinone oxidoreductase n=1 Tax=Parerythrobacter lutipelagi TaxID=1964208 RepID=UPI001F023D8E|nr:NAD(P)H-quinone oxidoreductase [Parerythrobacter lutipelagi]